MESSKLWVTNPFYLALSKCVVNLGQHGQVPKLWRMYITKCKWSKSGQNFQLNCQASMLLDCSRLYFRLILTQVAGWAVTRLWCGVMVVGWHTDLVCATACLRCIRHVIYSGTRTLLTRLPHHTWARGTPFPLFPLVHSLPHLLPFFTFSFFPFSFFPFLNCFTYFLRLSIPSLYFTGVVLLHFQAGGRRRQPNLGLVCCVYFVLSVLLSKVVKIYSGVLLCLV